jgi:hypothetical protein
MTLLLRAVRSLVVATLIVVALFYFFPRFFKVPPLY